MNDMNNMNDNTKCNYTTYRTFLLYKIVSSASFFGSQFANKGVETYIVT